MGLLFDTTWSPVVKPLVIATILAFCAGPSFSKEPSPACAALQNAKEASASGQKFEPYRIVTNDGEQLIATPQQAIDLWAPACQRQKVPDAKAGVSAKAAVDKSG